MHMMRLACSSSNSSNRYVLHHNNHTSISHHIRHMGTHNLAVWWAEDPYIKVARVSTFGPDLISFITVCMADAWKGPAAGLTSLVREEFCNCLVQTAFHQPLVDITK